VNLRLGTISSVTVARLSKYGGCQVPVKKPHEGEWTTRHPTCLLRHRLGGSFRSELLQKISELCDRKGLFAGLRKDGLCKEVVIECD
jgi:hypothetical protein